MSVAAVNTSGDGIGEPARRRLAGFVRTLRDNGFKIGLAETRDALEILAAPLAVRPSTLKPALRSLFCATHSDWERFDEIFEAFWQGRGIHQARTLAGSALESRAPARHLKDVGPRAGMPGLPDHVERRHDDDGGDSAGDGRGRREGASRFENLTSADLRHIVDPADIAQAHALAARLSRAMRARLVRR
ncbi:MAG: carbon monoxide dehydrogenase, partial [Pseudolabrys sp.]